MSRMDVNKLLYVAIEVFHSEIYPTSLLDVKNNIISNVLQEGLWSL